MYKVAQIKQPPSLKGKTKKHVFFFVSLNFFIFAVGCQKKSQKSQKIEEKHVKFWRFFFITIYEYVTKSAFVYPIYEHL